MDRAVAWLKRHVTEVWREKEEGTRGGGRSGGSKQGGRNEDDWSSDHDDDDDDDIEEDEITATTTTTSNHKGEKKTDNNGRKGAGAGDKSTSGGKDNKDSNSASSLPLHDVLNLSTVSMANGTGWLPILSFIHFLIQSPSPSLFHCFLTRLLVNSVIHSFIR